MRQCPNRYAFRAGRNLPDKEFRYLRTVIVTAAVYWGGRLLKGNGGAQRFPQNGWKSFIECKGIRELDCETYKSSRVERRT